MQFQVDVSRRYKNKEGYEAGGYLLNTSFITETHTPETFIQDVVKSGYPYTMVHLKRSPEETGAVARNIYTPKHIENFVSSQLITLDDDRGTPTVVQEWLNCPFFERYGLAFVESASSTPEKQRGHAIFLLDKPVEDPDKYKAYMQAACYQYISRVDWLVNIDRTIYNGENKPVYLINRVLPTDIFEREVLLPWTKNESIKLQDYYEKMKRQEATTTLYTGEDAHRYENYIRGFLDWMINHISTKSKGDNRNIAIYWAGRTVAGITQTEWAKPYLYVLDGIEDRVIDACRQNGYLQEYAHNNTKEILRIYTIGFKQGGSLLTPPLQTETAVHQRLDEIRPQLTAEQKRQANIIIEDLAEDKSWVKFHNYLVSSGLPSSFPTPINNHFQFGIRPEQIDRETGEIHAQAVSVPFYTSLDVVSCVEYRLEEQRYEYDGVVSLYYVKPMFSEPQVAALILPDSMQAVRFYLSGSNDFSIFGMPHHTLDDITLPDTERFCIFDNSVNTDILEQLASVGTRFVRVTDTERFIRAASKADVQKIAVRGKKLFDII